MYLLAPLFNGGHEVDHQAEAAERAYALSDLEQERAAVEFEARHFGAPGFTPDDGADHYDPADAFCLSFASPTVYERDANEVFHDRYRGAFA